MIDVQRPQALVAEQIVGVVFDQFADFLMPGTYLRAGTTLATVKFLAMPVPPDVVDGITVLPNDEKLLFDAVELATVDQPRPDDYVIQTSNGLRRNVVTAHLDVTGTFWTVVARKVFA